MASHDPLRQLKYLRQTLSQDKKPLGFFLSAGCPLAIRMPDDEWPLIPDVKGLTDYVSEVIRADAGLTEKYSRLIGELNKSGQAEPNIEDILSFLRGMKHVSKGADNIRGFSEGDLIDIEEKICQTISHKLKVELPHGKTPYGKVDT